MNIHLVSAFVGYTFFLRSSVSQSLKVHFCTKNRWSTE